MKKTVLKRTTSTHTLDHYFQRLSLNDNHDQDQPVVVQDTVCETSQDQLPLDVCIRIKYITDQDQRYDVLIEIEESRLWWHLIEQNTTRAPRLLHVLKKYDIRDEHDKDWVSLHRLRSLCLSLVKKNSIRYSEELNVLMEFLSLCEHGEPFDITYELVSQITTAHTFLTIKNHRSRGRRVRFFFQKPLMTPSL